MHIKDHIFPVPLWDDLIAAPSHDAMQVCDMTMRRPSLNMRTDSVFISGFLAGEESDPGQNSRDSAALKLCQKILSTESSGNAGKLVEISDLGESSSTRLRKTANDKKGSAQKNAGKNVDQGSRIFNSLTTLKEKSSEEPQ